MAEANPAVDFSQLLKNLGPLFFGSGTTNTEETSPGSAAAMGNIQALLASIMPQITGTAGTDNVVQSIMSRAAQAFAPISFAGNNVSGLYKNSAVEALKGEAIARATGESSQYVLQHQTDAAKIAATLTGQMGQVAGQTKSTTAKTAPAINPLISGAVAAAGVARSVLNKKKSPDDSKDPTSNLPPGTSDVYKSVSESLNGSGAQFGTDVGTNTSGSLGGNTSTLGNVEEGFSSVAEDATTLSSTGVDTAGLVQDANGTWQGVSGFGQAADGALGDAALLGGAGDATAVGVGTAADVGLAGDLGLTAGADAGIGDLLLEAAPAASLVICTELMRQGLLDRKLWESGAWYNGALNPYTKVGYHFWGIPYVHLMRRSALATKLVRPFAVGRYEYIAGKENFRGWLTCVIGEPICTFLGHIIAPLMLDIPSIVPPPVETPNG